MLTYAHNNVICLSNVIKLDLEGTIDREVVTSLISRIVAIVLKQMIDLAKYNPLGKIANIVNIVGPSDYSVEGFIQGQSHVAHEFETQLEQNDDEYLDMLGEEISDSH